MLTASKIYKMYFWAAILYAIPLVFLGLFILDDLGSGKSEMLYWVIFLVGMFPAGFIGLIISIVGLRKSKKSRDMLNLNIGIWVFFAAVLMTVGGVLGCGLIYVLIEV